MIIFLRFLTFLSQGLEFTAFSKEGFSSSRINKMTTGEGWCSFESHTREEGDKNGVVENKSFFCRMK